MNTSASLPVRDNKRIFAQFEAGTISTTSIINMTQEKAVKEVDTSSVEATADRSSKRSRMHSPVSEPTKVIVVPSTATPTDADDASLPLMPIVFNSVPLPNPTESKVSPDEYLQQLIKAQLGVSLKVQNGLELGEDYFTPITEEQHAAYTMEVLTPARDNNVEALKELVEQKGRQAVDCVNRFGESLLNLACRRGFTETAEFLLSDKIGLNVKAKDDFGRTALHDAMWNPKPQLEVCAWLIEREPSLLLVTDKRGNTPFQYAREEDFSTWRQFLFDNRSKLEGLAAPATMKRFC